MAGRFPYRLYRVSDGVEIYSSSFTTLVCMRYQEATNVLAVSGNEWNTRDLDGNIVDSSSLR